MIVNSINNILYLKDMRNDSGTKKPERNKVASKEEHDTGGSVQKSVKDVEKENLTAGGSAIEDFEQAKQVLLKVVDLMGQGKDNTLSAHSGKAIEHYPV